MPESVRDTIARVAQEEGIDPSYALAVAERESNFNPNAGGKGTIRGLFQMTQASRRAAGQADNASVEDQTRAFARHTRAVQGEMHSVLGRDPTPEETYLGHHFGGVRAGRTVAGQYNGMAPGDVFSPNEMAGNPHFGKAASMDQLAGSITGDIAQRRSRFGGSASPTDETGFAAFGQPEQPVTADDKPIRDAGTPASKFDFSQFGEPPKGVDFSGFGQAPQVTTISAPSNEGQKSVDRPGTEIDLSRYGQPMAAMPQPVTAFAPPGSM